MSTIIYSIELMKMRNAYTPTLTGVLRRKSAGTTFSALSRRGSRDSAACWGSVGYALKPGFVCKMNQRTVHDDVYFNCQGETT